MMIAGELTSLQTSMVPKMTWRPSKKLSPMMMTVAPPVVHPSLGLMALMQGAAPGGMGVRRRSFHGVESAGPSAMFGVVVDKHVVGHRQDMSLHAHRRRHHHLARDGMGGVRSHEIKMSYFTCLPRRLAGQPHSSPGYVTSPDMELMLRSR
ncbi:hypothetical protein EYF80_023374 [Liparis tanakae]|uniref:Uncharacterized protein n=1 Tax=Liparis tanakae TaxID=230148 RepID=A0A4Z2HKZ3_9TELE|nr:hypothetical protein EYF80_023374 [Liparis tanakae]